MTEGKFDEAKGRAKEALGDLSGREDLEREGKVDRASGATKGKVGALFDKVKETFRSRGPGGGGRGTDPDRPEEAT